VTLSVTDAKIQLFNTAITGAKTVTLPAANLSDGLEFAIWRRGGGSGPVPDFSEE
jgi:hypothetical protein